MSSFDFDAAVTAPFRMQPGLRRLAAGAAQLTVAAPGSRHMREKLAVLSTYAAQALLVRAGFDARPALDALAAHASREHPDVLRWDGQQAQAIRLGVAVHGDEVRDLAAGSFGLGDEVGRCLRGLPPGWRLAGLLSLVFEEDFALVDANDGTVPWLAVCLPSHWAPEHKVGRAFTEVHAPVADNTLLIGAAPRLIALVTGADRWERFVWTITAHPRLHAHPERLAHPRWPADTDVAAIDALACWRTERQTFIPLLALGQAVFTIHVTVAPLREAISAQQAARLHDAVASMSDAVLLYRGLTEVRAPLLGWLARRVSAA